MSDTAAGIYRSLADEIRAIRAELASLRAFCAGAAAATEPEAPSVEQRLAWLECDMAYAKRRWSKFLSGIFADDASAATQAAEAETWPEDYATFQPLGGGEPTYFRKAKAAVTTPPSPPPQDQGEGDA